MNTQTRPKGRLVRLRINEDILFDFNRISKEQGIYYLTVSNKGTSQLYINDATQELILPDEHFVVESDIPIINSEFSVRFEKTSQEQHNDAIISYIVVLDCY